MSYRISESTAFVLSRPDRVVVYDLDHPHRAPLALLGTGAAIWTALTGGDDDPRPLRFEAELLSELAADYGVEVDQLRGDVTSFLARMTADGYLAAEG